MTLYPSLGNAIEIQWYFLIREIRCGEATSRTFFSSNAITRTVGGAVIFCSLPVKPLKKEERREH